MNQERIKQLVARLFSSTITKTQYDELRNAIDDVSDHTILDGLEDAWHQGDLENAMPNAAKYRVKEEIDRSIARGKVIAFARKAAKVAATVALPLLLATTIYLAVDIHHIKQHADLLDVYVAKGEKATVNLPDGSTVTLNSDSKLYYPSNFSSKERWIRLEGEAYFHVKKSHGRTFTVKTSHMDVQVLGTTFNVTAYKDDSHSSVVLVEGSVAASAHGAAPTIIKPNQRYTLDNGSGDALVADVESYNYTCWRDGIINFESEPIVSVLNKLARQFDLKFEFDAALFKADRITGKIDLNDGVEAALKTVSLTSPLHFVKTKNKVIITPQR